MQPLVAGNEFIGECEAGHETALLEPEDGGEGAGKEDAFNGGEGDKALGEGGGFVLNPFDGPVGLFADAGDCGDASVLWERRDRHGRWQGDLLLSMALKR